MTEHGILKAYNAGTHRATVQLVGSVTTYLDDLKVARNISGSDMTVGRHVYVTIPDDNREVAFSNPGTQTPANAVITAVFDA